MSVPAPQASQAELREQIINETHAALEPLTWMQRLYVVSRVQGMSHRAAAAAAGYHTKSSEDTLMAIPAVALAMKEGAKAAARVAVFNVEQANEMLMEAFANAVTATEQVNAVKALIQLHGIEPPKKVDLNLSIGDQTKEMMRTLPTADLAKLAGLGEVLEGEFRLIEDTYEVEQQLVEAPVREKAAPEESVDEETPDED